MTSGMVYEYSLLSFGLSGWWGYCRCPCLSFHPFVRLWTLSCPHDKPSHFLAISRGWGVILCMVQPIRLPENHGATVCMVSGLYWTLNLMARKPLLKHLSVITFTNQCWETSNGFPLWSQLLFCCQVMWCNAELVLHLGGLSSGPAWNAEIQKNTFHALGAGIDCIDYWRKRHQADAKKCHRGGLTLTCVLYRHGNCQAFSGFIHTTY